MNRPKKIDWVSVDRVMFGSLLIIPFANDDQLGRLMIAADEMARLQQQTAIPLTPLQQINLAELQDALPSKGTIDWSEEIHLDTLSSSLELHGRGHGRVFRLISPKPVYSLVSKQDRDEALLYLQALRNLMWK